MQTEAGSVFIDISEENIGDKKYLDFGQEEKLPIITVATQDLAMKLVEHIKK